MRLAWSSSGSELPSSSCSRSTRPSPVGFVLAASSGDPRLVPLLLILGVFPIFYFVSPYTWLSEPRYLTLVVPVFALARSRRR